MLAVYSLLLVHTVIPHEHDVHNYLNKAVAIFSQSDDNDLGGKQHHAQEQDSHQLLHHSASQHPDNYTLSSNTTDNQLSQLLLLIAHCTTLQNFDLTPTVIDIDRQDIYYVPLKIPIQFSSALPLRAPPIV
jgi:hypothetical protein